MTARQQRPWVVRYTDKKGRVRMVTKLNVTQALVRSRQLSRAGNKHVDIAPKEAINSGNSD